MVLWPVELALARPERKVPLAGPQWVFEPKLDGWRGCLFAAVGVLQSRRDNDLGGRFPEIVAAGRGLGEVVLDGELVALQEGRLDFGALATAPRTRAAAGVAVYFVVFDVLADGPTDWRPRPQRERREHLVARLAGVLPPLQLMPSTVDRDEAVRMWMNPDSAQFGVEGICAKRLDRPYRAGRTGDWIKVRHTAVVDAVVIGVTGRPSRPVEVVLARPDPEGTLRGIGLSLPLPSALRDEVGQHVTVTGEPAVLVSGGGFGVARTEYLPVHPTLVVEVQAEASVESFTNRLRPTIQRVRPDMTLDDLA